MNEYDQINVGHVISRVSWLFFFFFSFLFALRKTALFLFDLLVSAMHE